MRRRARHHLEFLQSTQPAVLPLGCERFLGESLSSPCRHCVPTIDIAKREEHSATITRKFGTISGSSFVSGLSRRERSGPRIPSFSDSSSNALPSSTSTTETPQAERGALTLSVIGIHILRILLFVPWCAAVGGALLLFPSHVETVAFRPGYLPSPKGIRRFAHWAECGQQHVAIFLACLVVVVWYNRPLGLSVASVVATRFAVVWSAFEVDWSIPLGEDDQQSLYLVMTGLASRGGSFRVSGLRGQGGLAAMTMDDTESSSLRHVNLPSTVM